MVKSNHGLQLIALKFLLTFVCFTCIFTCFVLMRSAIARSHEPAAVNPYPSLSYKKPDSTLYQFSWKQTIAPAAALTMAAIQHTAWAKNVNEELRLALYKTNWHTSVDEYLQYAPAVAGFAPELAGVYGKHHILDKSILLLTAIIAETAIVNGMKYTFRTMRPDGSAHNSFPSGHTATAFMGAELLRREYGHLSVGYTIGGYAAATLTAYLRMQNQRHWLTDVVAGAGIGIFSTQIAYWIYPYLRDAVFAFKKPAGYAAMLIPQYTQQTKGIGLWVSF
jgi:hypothetical protein